MAKAKANQTEQTAETSTAKESDTMNVETKIDANENIDANEIVENKLTAFKRNRIVSDVDTDIERYRALESVGILDAEGVSAALEKMGLSNPEQAYANMAAKEKLTYETDEGEIALIESVEDWRMATLSASERLERKIADVLKFVMTTERDRFAALATEILAQARVVAREAGIPEDVAIKLSPNGDLSAIVPASAKPSSSKSAGEKRGSLGDEWRNVSSWSAKYKGEEYFLTLTGTKDAPKFLLSGGEFSEHEVDTPNEAARLIRMKVSPGVVPNVNASQWWKGDPETADFAKEFWG